MSWTINLRAGSKVRQSAELGPHPTVSQGGVNESKITISLAYGRLILTSLSAVSGAPRDATVRSCMLSGGALRIQRLEGSRAHGRLCTLNRSERVQGNQEGPELGGIRLPECLTERRVGWPRPDAETGEPGV